MSFGIRYTQNYGRDMDGILAIEEKTSTILSRWSKDDFLAQLRQRNIIGNVVEDSEGKIVGFIIYELEEKKINVLHLIIDPDTDISAVGECIFKKLKSKLTGSKKNLITFSVREGSTPIHLLLRSHNFTCFKVLRNHFIDSDEDAYLFQYRLPNSETGEVFLD